MRSYLYKGGRGRFWRIVGGVVGVIGVGVLIAWRYDSYYPLRKTEEEVHKEVVEYVFFSGKEMENMRFERFCYEFSLPANSVFKENTLLELVGEYTIDTANDKFEKKRLMITQVKEVSVSLTSVSHIKAVVFAFLGQQQRFLAKKMDNFLGKYMDNIYTELVITMILGNIEGNRKEVVVELKDLMRQSGLSHVLSVSGFHVNLIFSILEALVLFIIMLPISLYSIITKKTRKNRQIKSAKELPNSIKKANTAFLILCLLWYAVLVGASASIVRATMMMVFRLIDRYFIKFKLDVMFVLFLVIIIMLVFNPFYMYSVSFLLSVSATWGVLLSGRLWKVIKKNWLTRLGGGLFSSIVVTLMTAPVLIWYFEEVNLASLISNIILVPLVVPMILGLPIIYGLSFLREMVFFGDLVWQPALDLYKMLYEVFFFGLERWTGASWTIKIAQNRLQIWQIVVYYLIIGIIMMMWQPLINCWQSHQRKKQ